MLNSNYNDDRFRYNCGCKDDNNKRYPKKDNFDCPKKDFDDKKDDKKDFDWPKKDWDGRKDDKKDFDDLKKELDCLKKDLDKIKKDKKEDICCCKKSMLAALKLLTNDKLRDEINFNAFAFLTDNYIVGAELQGLGFTDNITEPEATLQRISPSNCDLLEVAGEAQQLYEADEPGSGDEAVDITRISVCALRALAFNLVEGDEDDFEDFIEDLRKLLDKDFKKDFDKDNCKCECDECCCNKGITDEILGSFDRNVILAAGPLFLDSSAATVGEEDTVQAIGRIGNVLVLARRIIPDTPENLDAAGRIYFVCLDAVELIG